MEQGDKKASEVTHSTVWKQTKPNQQQATIPARYNMSVNVFI